MLLLASTVAASTSAQAAGSLPAGSQARFTIPAGRLSDRLDSFARQSGWTVQFPHRLAEDLRTRGLSGNYKPETAIRLLLADTSLHAAFDRQHHTIQVSPRGTTGTAETIVVRGAQKGIVARNSSAGTKTDTPLIETPQSISVITQAQLRQQNLQTVAQAVQYGTNVATGTRGGYDSRFDYAMIRGFNESVQGDYRDGMRQDVGIGSAFSYFGTEPYGLESIEVVHGTSSATYGANSPGGLINRNSKLPTDDTFHELEMDVGSNNWYQGRFDTGGKVDGSSNVLYRLTGVVRDADGVVPREKNNRIYLAPAVTVRLDHKTTITFLGNYERDLTGVGTVARAANGQLTQTTLDDPSYSHFRRQQGQIGYLLEHHLTEAITLRQTFRYGLVDTYYTALNQSTASGSKVSRYAIDVQEALRTYGADNQAEAKFRTGTVDHTALVGFEYFRSTLGQSNLYSTNVSSLNLADPIYGIAIPTPTTPITNARQTLNLYGLYIQEQASWNRFHLVLSGRQDWAGTDSNNLLTHRNTGIWNTARTGRAALLYETPFGLSPYVSVSDSFIPNLGTSYSGQAFSPTTGLQEEVGIKYQPTGLRSFTTVSLYNINERNVLVTDPVHTSYSAQTGEIRSRGIELETHAELGWGLSLVGSYTYDDVKNTRSSPANTVNKIPIAVPTQLASLWLAYSHTLDQFSDFGIGGGIRYTGPTYLDAANTARNPAQRYFDAEAHYDFGRWRVQLNGYNLTNRRVASCYGTVCTMNENRFVLSSLRYRW